MFVKIILPKGNTFNCYCSVGQYFNKMQHSHSFNRLKFRQQKTEISIAFLAPECFLVRVK